MVRVRFAPSPTGYLHVGGLRTAFYNWAFARKNGGTFIVRIEDTDRTRLVEGAVDNLLQSLRWAGIEPDVGPHHEDELGPYVQSERLVIYREHVERLIADGKAYYCFATAEELEEMRSEQQARGETPMYDGRYRNLDLGEARSRVASGEPYVVRMKVPKGEDLVFNDVVRGLVSISTDTVDDQVLLKSDGFPTYHLAAVVDDHLMKISHVIRGEEWLTSTPKHILLNRFFDWEPPLYAHLPLIVNKDRKKLSKRDGDVSVESYRQKGYSSIGLVNFLALLGWNAGDDKEFYGSLEEIAEAFSLERINKSAAVFDIDKLTHINFLHLRQMPSDELVRELLPYFQQEKLEVPEAKKMADIIEMMRERAQTFADYVLGCRYFYEAPLIYDEKTLKKRWKEDSAGLVKAYCDSLASCPWTLESLELELRQVAEGIGAGAGRLIHPVRLALSGVGSGPGLFEMMLVLGRDECLRRLTKAVNLFSEQLA